MAFENKVALITGAASGIGLATAKVLMDEGLKKIALIDIQEFLDPLDLRVKYPDASIIYMQSDVTSEEQIRNAFQETLQKFGTIDIVINAAGIALDSKWRQEVEVNLNGTIIVTMVGLDTMEIDKNGKGGTIVNISSDAALFNYPAIPIYTATKMGVLGLSQCFGSDLFLQQTGVKVISICPSGTMTGMCPPSDDICLDKDFLKHAIEELRLTIQMQKANSVGKCILEAIVDGES